MPEIKISQDFFLHEFVPKIIYDKYGEKAKWFIRPEIIKLAQFYREFFQKPVYINNWFWSGPRHNRGFRTPNTTVGALYSQHKLGAAFDCNIKNMAPDEVRRIILANEQEFMRSGLTTLEDGQFAPTWIHSDIRPTGLSHILIVRDNRDIIDE